ncbi:MAG: septum formation initiator family protein [Leptospira sp.]|nr:septum formation initiator family protein [Leptospira sp.]
MSPFRAASIVAYLSSLFFVAVLSESGLAERLRLEKELKQTNEEVDRLVLENQGLEEKERRLKSDAYALEKEARKYYLLSENAYVLKFESPKEIENSGKLARAELGPEWKEPPLFLIRFFYIAFSVFLVLAVYWKLKGLPSMSNGKRLN